MKKVLFVMVEYPDWRQQFFEKYMSPKNKAYAEKHGFEYIEMRKLPREPDGTFYRSNPTWLKHKVVHDWIQEGFLEDGDIVSHIDADICIFNDTESFEPAPGKSFGYAIDSCNSHCMGAYTIRVNDWSREMLRHMLDDEFYGRMKNDHHWKSFREQAAWYTMTGTIYHSWVPFSDMPNYGFHSSPTRELKYTLEELEENVQVFPTEWNVTHIAGEGFNDYFMIPTVRQKTVFRHFAGGQRWQSEYFTGQQRQPNLDPAHLGTRAQAEEYETNEI